MITLKFIEKYKDLFVQLTLRDVKSKYKQSILGYAWVLLVPLINLLILNIVFQYFFRVPTGDIAYPVYLFVALVPWTFTSNSISAATNSIVTNESLITKVFFPREIIPLSAISSKIVDLILMSLVVVLFLFIYNIHPGITMLYVVPIFTVQLILIIGVSLILSSINVFFRDVENILGVFLNIWMYLTPIIYPPELIPENVRFIFGLNPMVGIINSYRNTILYGVPPPWASFSFSIIISVILFIIGIYTFKRLSKYFADVV
jgi:ABC-type polysaccharide/polyol phosphate export permease